MFKFKKAIHSILLLSMTLSVLLTSCGKGIDLCQSPRIKMPCCLDGRRPSIMMSQYEEIYDFDEGAITCEELRHCEQLRRPEILPALPIEELHQAEMERQPEDYRFVCGDSLEICVIGDQDTFSDRVVIAPDGCIYYQFLDGIVAEGRTIHEVKGDLEKGLKTYYTDPSVALIPTHRCNQCFVVLGRVKNPGSYPLTHPLRVRDAIAHAGGVLVETMIPDNYVSGNRFAPTSTQPVRQFAPIGNAFLMRDGRRYEINFHDLVFKGDERKNVLLRPGDYIYLPPAEKAQVYVLGAVRGPRVVPFSDRMTLISALTSVGGWYYGTPWGADLNRVLIIRGSLECPSIIWVDLQMLMRGEARDVYLCPGDIVYCQNKNFRLGRELVQIAIDSFVEAFISTWTSCVASEWFPGIDSCDDGNNNNSSNNNSNSGGKNNGGDCCGKN
jgi:protein involved in polysaccharide export with SLBB domain